MHVEWRLGYVVGGGWCTTDSMLAVWILGCVLGWIFGVQLTSLCRPPPGLLRHDRKSIHPDTQKSMWHAIFSKLGMLSLVSYF